MATKHNCKCLETAKDDEPIFVLKASDMLAPMTIEWWAHKLQRAGGPQDKVNEALEVARAMRLWPSRKIPD